MYCYSPQTSDGEISAFVFVKLITLIKKIKQKNVKEV